MDRDTVEMTPANSMPAPALHVHERADERMGTRFKKRLLSAFLLVALLVWAGVWARALPGAAPPELSVSTIAMPYALPVYTDDSAHIGIAAPMFGTGIKSCPKQCEDLSDWVGSDGRQCSQYKQECSGFQRAGASPSLWADSSGIDAGMACCCCGGGRKFSAKIRLLTTTYIAGAKHDPEVLAAVSENLLNPAISAVYTLHQTQTKSQGTAFSELYDALLRNAGDRKRNLSAVDFSKLKVIEVFQQPTYKDMFDYATNFLQGGFVLLANADVAFDKTLQRFTAAPLLSTNRCMGYAISVSPPPPDNAFRGWFPEYKECRPTNRCLSVPRYKAGRSYDAFLFSSPLPTIEGQLDVQSLALPNGEYVFMNSKYAEHHAATFLADNGFAMANPCHFVHGFHYHCAPKMHHSSSVPEKDNKVPHDQSTIPACTSVHLCGLSLF